MRRTIVIQFKVSGLHNWPEGHPDFLRYPHRHDFHIRFELPVEHNERELEIITVEAEVANWMISTKYRDNVRFAGRLVDFGARSCETIAEEIFTHLIAQYDRTPLYVEVLEDAVLGGKVYSDEHGR